MRLKYLLLFSIIILFSKNAFSTQFCPKNIMIEDKHYSAPKGWHVTSELLENANEKLIFHIAVWNYDQKVGADNNQITCSYKNGTSKSNVDITTDQTNFKKPIASPWADLDSNSSYCFPTRPVDPNDCGWE